MVLMGVTGAFAGGPCSKEEVKKAVEYAVDLIDAKGEAAFVELEKFRFCGGEGYVWVNDFDGVVLMHPISKKLEGVNQVNIQDPTGKYFYAEFLGKVKKDGEGWVSYKWLHPKTNTLENKCSYAKAARVAVKGKKVWCAAGVYGISEADCK